MLVQLLGDPVDMNALLKALLIVIFTVCAVSVKIIDEECLACGRRECPMNVAKPLRKLSLVEWAYDTTGDIHLNRVCTTVYTLYVNKEN